MTTHGVREDATQPRSRPARSPIAESMRCPTVGCGAPAHSAPFGNDSPPDGWVRVFIAGAQDPARWFCGGSCASRGIARVELHHHLPPDRRPRDLTVAVLPRQAAAPTTVGCRPHGPGTASQERKARLERVGATVVEVREWGWANGHHVGAKGVPSGAVVEAFLAAREQVGA